MYDVIVIGSGIAGSSCAAYLAQQFTEHVTKNGKRIGLISPRQASPFKVGEALPGAALTLLNRLGIHQLGEILSADQYLDCVGQYSAWGSEIWLKKDSVMNPQGGGWHLNRVAFEQALMAFALQSGVHHCESNVVDIAKTPKYWQITTNTGQVFVCPWLVDATGRRQIVVKYLSDLYADVDFPMRKQPAHHQLACVAWVAAAEDDREQTTRVKSVADGWWYSALTPMASEGIYTGLVRVIVKFGAAHQLKNLQKQPSEFFRQCAGSGLLANSFNPLKQRSLQPLQLVDAGVSRLTQSWFVDQLDHQVKGCIAIGDAAMTLDPMSSQGMFFALYSAIQAAQTLTEIIMPTRVKQGADETDPHTAEAKIEAQGLDAYQRAVNSVFNHNERTRTLMRASEARFTDNPFWQVKAPCLI